MNKATLFLQGSARRWLDVGRHGSLLFAALLGMALALQVGSANAAGTTTASLEQTYVSSADLAGPALPDDPSNESVVAYNKSIQLYQEREYEAALETMRAAVRARGLVDDSTGLAYSNLCLMYLRVGKFLNAEAACTRALMLLPNYIPAVLNLARAERRESPE